MIKNDRCDGAYCILSEGEVKKYPIGTDSHMILCVHCWGHENRFREDMAKEHNNPENWPQQNWFEFEPYEGSGNILTKTDIIKKFAAEHGMTVVDASQGWPPPGHHPDGYPDADEYKGLPTIDEVIANINEVLGNKPKK